MLLQRVHRPFMGVSGLLLVIMLVSACAGVTNSNKENRSTTVTSTATTSTGTPAPTSTRSTQPSVVFQSGGIAFIGLVKSSTGNTLVMGMPNGETFTMTITNLTDLSAFGGNTPSVGTSVDTTTTVNPDGSFTATILAPASPNDPDQNVIDYTGITTSAVGTDNVIQLTVGTKTYTFTIVPSITDLTDFANAQSIGNHVPVKVSVQFNGTTETVIKVGSPNN